LPLRAGMAIFRRSAITNRLKIIYLAIGRAAALAAV
jgi:hypothetical protein